MQSQTRQDEGTQLGQDGGGQRYRSSTRKLCFLLSSSPYIPTDFKYNSESCHLQKFSDDSAVVGCIREREEGESKTLIDGSVECFEQNHLRLNVNKTKEMVIDFRRKKMRAQPLLIRREVVEEVEDYRYLGFVIDNRLDWKSDTEGVYKKGKSRL